MATLVEHAIREPSTATARQYAQRVHRLAAAYAAVFVGSLAGIALLVWQAQLYVNLAQRSNVETLTLGFFLIFFVYIAFLSVGGAVGAARILYYTLRTRLSGDRAEGERRKERALGAAKGAPASVALNLILEKEMQPGEAFTLPVADGAGSLGAVVVDGAHLMHRDALKDGSNNMLAYVVEQVNQILQARGAKGDLDIVEWKRIDDEQTEQYLGMICFARNLERHLGCDELWPKRTLTAEDCTEVERRLAAICPALRNESFLPHWEYAGEHKIPLIPEPLGLVSLSRTEKRVDPVASMGCAFFIIVAVVIALILIFLFPPWVPGA